MTGEITRDINGNWHQHTKDCSYCYPNNIVIATDKSSKYMETKDWVTEFEKFMQEWMYSLKTENSYYALEKRMKNFISQLLSTQEEKIIEHIIKCIETDPEIKIPRSYDASWILTNLQFHKKVGEHQSPWFSKDNNL